MFGKNRLPVQTCFLIYSSSGVFHEYVKELDLITTTSFRININIYIDIGKQLPKSLVCASYLGEPTQVGKKWDNYVLFIALLIALWCLWRFIIFNNRNLFLDLRHHADRCYLYNTQSCQLWCFQQNLCILVLMRFDNQFLPL